MPNDITCQPENMIIEQRKNIWLLNKSSYILFVAVFIELAFIVFFSFTTKNFYSNSISLLIVAIITFPLGLVISRSLFQQKNISETIILSLCIGLPFSTLVWGMMAFLRIPMNPLIYFAVSFALPIGLLICLKRKLGFKNRELDINEICVPIIVLLVAFLWHSLMLANNNVPRDVDAQGPIYVQFLMKNQGYPVVYPFLNETKAYINYPPCFNVIVVLFSKLKMSLVYKECMAITVVCGSYFALSVFLLSYYLSCRNMLLAFIAGILALNRAYLTQYNDGNTTEMLSFLSIACLLIFLQHAFKETSRKLSAIIAVTAGVLFSVSAFSQTEIFNWYAISLAVFFPVYLVSKNKNFLKDYLVLIVAALGCIVFFVPWLLSLSGSYKAINFEQLFTQFATHLIPVLKYWHNPVFLVLSFVGIGVFFYRREKIMVYLGIHALLMVFLIIHWKFYRMIGFGWFKFTPTGYWSLGANGKFTTPFQFPNTFTVGWMSFTIVFPIATAYALSEIFLLIKRIRVKIEERYVALLISIIFLSAFQYFEFRNYLRYPEWLLETDYQALQWFQKNTTFDNCLILNPRNPIKLANGVAYWSSDWVPLIAERRAISSRTLDIAAFQMKITDTCSVNKTELLDVYNNILQLGAYDILKKSNITHIFISALQSGNLIQDYQKASFLQLAHYYSIPNLGTAVIYKVK
ncbi:MAG: hypothetical protein A3G70_00410 [Planctomycetes bacterium RIFCSPLOWO2_12_FULL_39_13]|nr:MAG: hypothetical protein A3G70_00410 [Planctomycetes bacterium RIFCSPLOWO2_12_FULL_39_13]